MDNVTHSLFGLALASAGLAKRSGPGTTAALVLASNAPDIDILFPLLYGEEGMLLRRGLTHSVFLLPILALILAFLMKLLFRSRKLRVFFLLSLLALACHVFFDLINSYGVVLFYPFALRRFELAWVFIVDPWLLALIAMPLLLAAVFRRGRLGEWCGKTAVFLPVLYLFLCALAHSRASAALDRLADSSNARPEFEYVFPEVFGPRYFRGVLRSENVYRMYLIDLWSGRSDLKLEEESHDGDPQVERAKASRLAQKVLWFFKAPVWSVDAKGGAVSVFDLRFRSLLLTRSGRHFVFHFAGLDEQHAKDEA